MDEDERGVLDEQRGVQLNIGRRATAVARQVAEEQVEEQQGEVATSLVKTLWRKVPFCQVAIDPQR